MITLFAFLLSTAHGFEIRTDEFGQPVKWQRKTIRYQVNPEGNHGLSKAAVNTMISAATRAWTAHVPGSLRFSHEGTTNIRRINHEDGANVIYFEDEWDQDPGLLALTYLWSATDGEVIGFDMAINAEHHQWSIDGRESANDLLNTLSHEFGHALAIDHSPFMELATMYPTSPMGEILKRDLWDDDINAVIHLYANFEDAGAVAAGCSAAGFNPNTLAIWLSIPLIAIHRHAYWQMNDETKLPHPQPSANLLLQEGTKPSTLDILLTETPLQSPPFVL
jgi:hypothetical protein